MPRVWVVQELGGRDFSDAERFGELRFILRRDIYADEAVERFPVIRKLLREMADDISPTNDYILLSGDPIAIFLAGAVLSIYSYIRLLKWDAEERKYYVVEIKL